jgi:hypothetical protein
VSGDKTSFGYRLIGALAFAALCCAALVMPEMARADDAPLVLDQRQKAAFPLVSQTAATILYDRNDFPVTLHAVQDLADDIAAVTGRKPGLTSEPGTAGRHAVIVGTLGHSRLVDQLVRQGRLKLGDLQGAWESFVITAVPHPFPGIESALVIAGSDRRGTAFGVYELSEAIGVSPWHWWADVPARKHRELWVPAGLRRFGPPSVRYRGIFLNDEDWGLFPWASRTFDPGQGNLGPKTYERVFQLLLRLKANTLWPAMHKVSTPFNALPENARLADAYAIVMGSSHAEPMLRNNVGEWKDAPEAFNYADNAQGVRRYWEERVASNAPYESLWTLGMRGIHDSSMVGAASRQERIDLLGRIIADQREMLRRHVSPDLSGAPQMFMPYKEVLDLYRGGLTVPDDVTIIWPDDNFGYIRQFPSAAERLRKGGMGVYYHLSYLGAPLSYLWLGTTPPALVREEMTRAWDAGARKVWIANVGDIKPAEIDISLFMEMAWNIDRWRHRDQPAFLSDWASRTFGPEHATAIGQLLDEHFRLNFERRPEHLQAWLPGESIPPPGGANMEIGGRLKLSTSDIDRRLQRFANLVQTSEAIGKTMRADQADAFFELVDYPVKAAAAANRRYFGAERYAAFVDSEPDMARHAAAVAVAADRQVKALTARYNDEVAGGKWRFLMAEEPADNQWRRFRLSPTILPAAGLVTALTPSALPTVMPTPARRATAPSLRRKRRILPPIPAGH